MNRQYRAQRRQGGANPLGVGIIAAGSIFYLQDETFFRGCHRGHAICRNPWLVEAFLNGTVAAGRKNPSTGRWEDVYVAGRADMAVLRSLRDGKRRQVAIRILILHDDLGLFPEPSSYPSLPDLRLYRCRANRQ